MKENSQKLAHWLRKADLFGHIPKFLYNGEMACNSRYGGIVSIFVVIAYALCVVFTVWRFFEKWSPEVNINTSFMHDPVGFQITNDTFPFSFGLQDTLGNHFIDEQVYTATATYIIYKRKSINDSIEITKEEIPLKLIRCSEAQLSHTYFKRVDLANTYCLEEFIQPKTPLLITGIYESETWGIIRLDFFRCAGANCKSFDEIEKTLSKGYFAIYYIDQAIQTNNYDHPVEYFPTSFFTTTSTTMRKTTLLRFEDQEIFTHNSLIGYVEPELFKFTKVKSFVTDLEIVSSTPISAFYRLELRMDQLKAQVNRKYKMVYQYLAEFGGLIQVVTLVALIFTYRFSKTKLTIDLLHTTLNQNRPLERLVTDEKGNLAFDAKGISFEQNHSQTNPSIAKVVSSPKKSFRSYGDHLKVLAPHKFVPKRLSRVIAGEKNISKDQFVIKESEASTYRPSIISHNDAGDKLMVEKDPAGFGLKQKACHQEKIILHHLHPLEDVGKALAKGKSLDHHELAPEQTIKLEESPKVSIPSSVALGESPKSISTSPRGALEERCLKSEKFKVFLRELQKQATLRSKVKNLKTSQIVGHSLWPFCDSGVGQLISLTHEEIECKFDMIRLLKTMNDLEKFLILSMTEEQRLLFELIPTSTILEETCKSKRLLAELQAKTLTPEEKAHGLLKAQTAIKNIQDLHSKSIFEENLLIHLEFLLTLSIPQAN